LFDEPRAVQEPDDTASRRIERTAKVAGADLMFAHRKNA